MEWYNQALNKKVELTYITLAGRKHTTTGELLTPTREGVEIKIKTYMPNNNYYILCVSWNRVVSVFFNGKAIYENISTQN